jgi:hypothetical protein
MTDQEIKAKALEIAVLIKGPPVVGGLSGDTDLILRQYLPLSDVIEQHIRGNSLKNQAKSAES